MTTLPARTTLVFTGRRDAVSLPFGRIEMSLIQTGGLDMVPVLFFVVLGSSIWCPIRSSITSGTSSGRFIASTGIGPRSGWADCGPMHALSRVTSLTALGHRRSTTTAGSWPSPGEIRTITVTLSEAASSLVIALIVFVWPLWSAHRLLTEAKEKGLSDVALRKEATRTQLHQAVDDGKLERVDPLHKALEALNAESAELAKVATWPWAPGTLRNLVGAVLLPMVLWLIQFGLQRLLG